MNWRHWLRLAWLILVSFSGNAVTPMIDAGQQASIFLNSDGSVWGAGSVTNYSPGATSPVRLLSLPNVVAVATGLGDYALLGDGTVWASGSFNNYGQLGDGTTQPHADPRRVSELSNVTAISAGGHVLALKADGTVWAWGLNAQGQLGDGTTIDRYSPAPVAGVSEVMRISVTATESLALKSDGTVWRWGGNQLVPIQVPNLDRVVAISGGGSYMALRADGTVWAWGSNDSGQLGDGSFLPKMLPAQIPGLSDVVAVDARGMRFSIALKADGSVWAWGNNSAGQLGVSGVTYSTRPIQVPGLADVVTIAAGFSHALAMRRDGTVIAWGDNSSGEIGDGTLQNRAEPRPVLGPGGSGQLNLVQPAPAHPNQLPSATTEVNPPSGRAPLSVNFIAHGKDPDGSVTAHSWHASDGQQATGPSASFVFSLAGTYTVNLLVEDNAGGRGSASVTVVVTQPIGTATSVNPKIGIYGSNGMALANDGRILSWGWDGGLGRPPQPGIFGQMIPVPSANGITGAVDIAIAPGMSGAKFVLIADGSVLAWGANDSGQLGLGSQIHVSASPQSLTNLPPAQALAAGNEHVLALSRDGKVFGWGRNSEGQLGLGDNQNRSGPVEIPGLIDVIAIAAGFNFSMALTADGTVRAWGENSTYYLGDGTQLARNRPVQVPGLANVQKIFTTGFNGIAIDADGAVWASGGLPFSFAGDANPPSVFRRVPLLDGAVQLAGMGQHIVFRKADGTVWVIGMRASMALGVDGTSDIQVPRQVPDITDAIEVAASANNSMVLRRDGTVLAWGRNSSGQLGDGTLANRLRPTYVVSETSDGVLDLIPDVDNNISQDKIPAFWTRVNRAIDVSNIIKYDGSSLNQHGRVFAIAYLSATSRLFMNTPAAMHPQAKLKAQANTTPLVPAVLTRSGWKQMTPNSITEAVYSGTLDARNNSFSLYDASLFDQEKETGIFCTGYAAETGTSAKGLIRSIVTGNDPYLNQCPPLNVTDPNIITLTPGWNLIGNGTDQSLNVTTSLNDGAKVNSVWSWNNNQWAMYAPNLSSQALNDYATGKGYTVLSTISGGQGFWVNAKQGFTLTLPNGNPLTAATSQPRTGWNLLAIGETKTPTQYSAAQDITSLWAWDTAKAKWYFYAPALSAQSGTALTEYLTTKGYLDFTTSGKTLGQGVGFWVNKP